MTMLRCGVALELAVTSMVPGKRPGGVVRRTGGVARRPGQLTGPMPAAPGRGHPLALPFRLHVRTAREVRRQISDLRTGFGSPIKRFDRDPGTPTRNTVEIQRPRVGRLGGRSSGMSAAHRDFEARGFAAYLTWETVKVRAVSRAPAQE